MVTVTGYQSFIKMVTSIGLVTNNLQNWLPLFTKLVTNILLKWLPVILIGYHIFNKLVTSIVYGFQNSTYNHFDKVKNNCITRFKPLT